jgi:hypothetical protein
MVLVPIFSQSTYMSENFNLRYDGTENLSNSRLSQYFIPYGPFPSFLPFFLFRFILLYIWCCGLRCIAPFGQSFYNIAHTPPCIAHSSIHLSILPQISLCVLKVICQSVTNLFFYGTKFQYFMLIISDKL